MMGNSLPQGKGFLSSYTSHQSVCSLGTTAQWGGTHALAGSVFLISCLVWLLWLWDTEEKLRIRWAVGSPLSSMHQDLTYTHTIIKEKDAKLINHK